MIFPWWVKPAAAIALALTLALGAKWFISATEQRGYDRAVSERQAFDNAKLAEATAQARAAETTLRNKFDTAATIRQQEKDRDDQTIADLRAAARSGAVRMRCPAASIHANPAPADSTFASGLEPEARSGDLLPETAGDIFDIAYGIAAGVRRENALIDAYNEARAVCNAPATRP